MKKVKNDYSVFRDSNSRTCIKLKEERGSVFFIPMEIENGFEVVKCGSDFFKSRYKIMDKYPVDKACSLYLGYCRILGATEEVMDYLSKKIKVTKEDVGMAVTKKKSRSKSKESKEEKSTAKKSTAKKSTAKKSTAKKSTAKKSTAKKRSASSSGEYRSAAAMFKELIMSGDFTDDEIFQQVQQEFGLDDNKRSYVKWYRNKLTKEDQNPPEPK